jgi:hypothetical protein
MKQAKIYFIDHTGELECDNFVQFIFDAYPIEIIGWENILPYKTIKAKYPEYLSEPFVFYLTDNGDLCVRGNKKEYYISRYASLSKDNWEKIKVYLKEGGDKLHRIIQEKKKRQVFEI